MIKLCTKKCRQSYPAYAAILISYQHQKYSFVEKGLSKEHFSQVCLQMVQRENKIEILSS